MAYDDKPSLDELMHYGMPRRSGRYPWGSGKDPYQHCTDFLSRVQYMVDNGVSDEDIAKSMGLTKEQFETEKSFAVVHDMTKRGKTEKEIKTHLSLGLSLPPSLCGTDQPAIIKPEPFSV